MKNEDSPDMVAIFSLPEGVQEHSVLSESRTIPKGIARQLKACLLYRGYRVGSVSENSHPSSHESPDGQKTGTEEIVVAGNPDSEFRIDVQTLADHFGLTLEIDATTPEVKRWGAFANLSRNGKWAAATIAAPVLRACGLES